MDKNAQDLYAASFGACQDIINLLHKLENSIYDENMSLGEKTDIVFAAKESQALIEEVKKKMYNAVESWKRAVWATVTQKAINFTQGAGVESLGEIEISGVGHPTVRTDHTSATFKHEYACRMPRKPFGPGEITEEQYHFAKWLDIPLEALKYIREYDYHACIEKMTECAEAGLPGPQGTKLRDAYIVPKILFRKGKQGIIDAADRFEIDLNLDSPDSPDSKERNERNE